jgi:hypothetical protein
MKSVKLFIAGSFFSFLISSCSVQQFGVNTTTTPFQNGGRVWGEKTAKDSLSLTSKKQNDLHVFGINVKNSDVKKMVDELNAKSYTIETKSNLWLYILTCGIVDSKIVKVIKREN